MEMVLAEFLLGNSLVMPIGCEPWRDPGPVCIMWGRKKSLTLPEAESLVLTYSYLLYHYTKPATTVHDISITGNKNFSVFSIFNLWWSKVTVCVNVFLFILFKGTYSYFSKSSVYLRHMLLEIKSSGIYI